MSCGSSLVNLPAVVRSRLERSENSGKLLRQISFPRGKNLPTQESGGQTRISQIKNPPQARLARVKQRVGNDLERKKNFEVVAAERRHALPTNGDKIS
jgi:hypothetical protein